MFNWLRKRRQRKQTECFNSGYNWAAGAILRKEETIESIEEKTYNNQNHLFAKGANAACRFFTKNNQTPVNGKTKN